MKNNLLVPLGGGQRVGASCYFLKLGDNNILLDVGMGDDRGLPFQPAYYPLHKYKILESLSQISQIFISHAHWDHVGDLSKFLKFDTRASVYMTETTAMLAEYQLYDKINTSDMSERQAERERMEVRAMLDRIVKVSYMQTMDFGSYKVTFLPAGHIPGAMMMLFEYEGKKFLYTGDYSLEGTALTDGCMVPDDMDIDTMLVCGLHAKQPDYVRRSDKLYRTIGYVYRLVESGKSVMCHVPQLTKGVELLRALDMVNYKHFPIYIDSSVMPVVEKLEKVGVPMLNEDIHVAAGKRPDKPHIYITSRNRCCGFGCYESVHVDFALHDDFGELKEFIRRVNPKQAYVVHCGETWRYANAGDEGTGHGAGGRQIAGEGGGGKIRSDRNIGQAFSPILRYPNALMPKLETELAKDPNSRTKIIYPEDEKVYVL